MRQLMVICAAVAATCALGLTSCEKKGNGKLDPSAKIYISPAKGVQLQAPTKANPEHLTAKEIVQKAEVIYTNEMHIGVSEWNRDLENSRFIVGSDWAIAQDGNLTYDFIGSRDYVFATVDDDLRPKDTIAYIPNRVMDDVQAAIEAAYSSENYSECYRLLQEAFVFTPITGAEYRALQAKGEN